MKIGFTGTRDGMTKAQRMSFERLFEKLSPTHFAHGDCVGSDHQAAVSVSSFCMGTVIVCHPPIDEKLRAFNKLYDEIREPKRHFARNRAIVDESDVLVATPRESSHQPRGGTWYTVDYATKKGKPVYVIWPDGRVASIGVPAEKCELDEIQRQE